jgi:N-acetylglucosaminyldiphosphoundecaprenol N-acetyl-beta-D-mannosaminyltransferase
MIDNGKRTVLGVGVNVIDYDSAVQRIIDGARNGTPLAVTALAVHGIMTGVLDVTHRYRLNHLDLVTPDGQPVRWALRLLHGERLPSRVCGPELILRVCAAAAKERLPVYLYGSRQNVLARLADHINAQFPGITIAGSSPSRFQRITPKENAEILKEIQMSGARLVFVGLGCPRQEVWAYENTSHLSMPVLAVGAAFDFHAGLLSQPRLWVQEAGLEWLFRLIQEPRRLWRRYLLLNPLFCWYIFLQAFGLRDFRSDDDPRPDAPINFA